MSDLKQILFEKTRQALDEYQALDAKLEEEFETIGWSLKPERDAAYERFCALRAVIDEAGLLTEYEK